MAFSWATPPKASGPMINLVIHNCSSRCRHSSDANTLEELESLVLKERSIALVGANGRPIEHAPDAPELHLSRPVYEEIMKALTSRPPEAGGLLLGPKNHHVVTHFYLDEVARATSNSFTLDHLGMNRVLKDYGACQIDAKGLVHSHPNGIHAPSLQDLEYVQRLFANPRNVGAAEILMPIICGGRFLPYVIPRDNTFGRSCRPAPAKLVLF